MYGNNITESNTYDMDRGWLTGKEYINKYHTIEFSIGMEYDNVGNINSQNIDNGSDMQIVFQYDNLYQLKGYLDQQNYLLELYSYCDNGNIIYLGGESFSISGTNNHITNSGYVYNANGNMTTQI